MYRKPIHINNLPREILFVVFSFLDIDTLDLLQYVCKEWKTLLKDQEVWKSVFENTLHVSSNFPSLSKSLSWKTELFKREEVHAIWTSKSSSFRNYRVQNQFSNSIAADFKLGRLIALSSLSGTLTICDIKNGKKEINFTVFDESLTSYKINTRFLIFGKDSGYITCKDLSPKKLFETNITFSNRHSGLVTAVDAISFVSRDRFGFVTAGIEGEIILWDQQMLGSQIKSLSLSNFPIIKVLSDFKKKVIALNTKGEIFIIDLSNNYSLQTIETGIEVNARTYNEVRSIQKFMFFDVDFGGENVIISYRNRIVKICFAISNYGMISSISLQEDSYSHQMVKSSETLTKPDYSVVGNDGLFCANVLNTGEIIIWNVRKNNGTELSIQSRIQLNNYSDENEMQPTTMNSSYLIVGVFPQNIKVYNIFTGGLVKTISIRSNRRKYSVLSNYTGLAMNDNIYEPCGIIINNDMVEYFEFGDIKTMKKKKNDFVKKKKDSVINDEITDGLNRAHQRIEDEKLREKINGDLDDIDSDADEELLLALAISENDTMNTGKSSAEIQEEEDLRLAILLSTEYAGQ